MRTFEKRLGGGGENAGTLGGGETPNGLLPKKPSRGKLKGENLPKSREKRMQRG